MLKACSWPAGFLLNRRLSPETEGAQVHLRSLSYIYLCVSQDTVDSWTLLVIRLCLLSHTSVITWDKHDIDSKKNFGSVPHGTYFGNRIQWLTKLQLNPGFCPIFFLTLLSDLQLGKVRNSRHAKWEKYSLIACLAGKSADCDRNQFSWSIRMHFFLWTLDRVYSTLYRILSLYRPRISKTSPKRAFWACF
jgi:hypothetical protein